MYRKNARDGQGMIKWLLVRDVYKISRWPRNYFNYVFDIGASIGVFSVIMRIYNPNAVLVAVEPGRDQFECLKVNLDLLYAEIINKAIGSGEKMFLTLHKRDKGKYGCYVIADSKVENSVESYEVETVSFSEIFYDSGCKFDDKYCIKVDCEGGEKYIVEDEKSVEIFKNAEHISFEIHFNAEKTAMKCWEEYSFYNDWVRSNFSESHKIEYYVSSRSGGYGHYCITKNGAI